MTRLCKHNRLERMRRFDDSDIYNCDDCGATVYIERWVVVDLEESIEESKGWVDGMSPGGHY